MSNLLLMSYNNYYNKIHKMKTTLAEYKTASNHYTIVANVNFNLADGVNTEHIINWQDNYTPDYLVVFNNEDVIESRWFILEFEKTRGGQYKAVLRRDLISDFETEIKGSTALIHRGVPVSTEDYTIYSHENNFNYNQIQKSEIALKDKTGVPWIIGYFNGSADNIGIETKPKADITVNTKPTGSYKVPTSVQPIIFARYNNTEHTYAFTDNGPIYMFKTTDRYVGRVDSRDTADLNLVQVRFAENRRYMVDTFFTYHTNYTRNVPSICENDGLIYYVSDEAKYYKLHVSTTYGGSERIWNDKASSEEEILNNYLVGEHYSYNPSITLGVRNTAYQVDYTTYTLNWEELPDTAGIVNIKTAARKLNDAPYKMFAIPYGKIPIVHEDTSGDEPVLVRDCYTLSAYKALNLARNIFTSYDSAHETGVVAYDIQLLPYCPMDLWYSTQLGEGFSIDGLIENEDYSWVKDDNTKVGIVLFPASSSFTGTSTFANIECPDNVLDFKVANETEFYRLVSPNYASMFEFKSTYNKKDINSFTYACTYKPYNPYINVYPTEIGGLYGRNFKNNFGLICAGDFSISLMNDAWKEYQINNKNYKASFDRQIQTLDLDIRQAKIEKGVGMVTGTISGAASGALTGAMIGAGGGPAGAIAGAVVGGVASAAAGVVDIVETNKKLADTRDAAITQHLYELGNVMAKPQTISTVSTVDINNKLFPILEHYGCSADEENILKMYLNYKGYNIGRISTISPYWHTYIEATLIWSDILDDTHLVNELNYELGKGVYIDESTE